MREIKLLSIVLPCHNEEEVLPMTHERLQEVVGNLLSKRRCGQVEILYVDNGSTDKTLSVLKGFVKANRAVRAISLRRNFGYHGAISAGMAHAKGDAIVTIDADLQDPPEKIEEMIGHYEIGYDLVLGVRNDRSADRFFQRLFAENYYRFLRWMGAEIVHNHGEFRLMARGIVDEFNKLLERNRFIRGMVLQLDSKYKTVSYKREARVKGQSKFNFRSSLSASLDGLISFSYVPLRLCSILGVIFCFVSIIGLFYVLYVKYVLGSFPGWASTVLPIFAFGGFQLLALGLIGEYIGRLYVEVKQRPLYLVRETYQHEG